jgi:HK97 family phage major capsid protein
MTTTATDPRAERLDLMKAIRDIAANAEQAARDFTPEERQDIEAKAARIQEITANLKNAARSQKLVEEVGEMLKAEEAGELNHAALEGTTLGLSPAAGGRRKSAGRHFVEGDAYKGLLQAHAGGRFSEKARIQSQPHHLDGGLKALVTSGGDTGTNADALVYPQQLGLVPGLPYIEPKLRNVITTGTTTTDRIEYAQVNELGVGGTVNNARAVAEATTADGPTADTTTGDLTLPAGSGVKPQSGLSFRKASADVITVAHWLPATKRALSDAAQVRTLIDEFLRRGIDLELDRLILKGNEAAPVGDEEWNGILNTTGVQNQAWDADLPRTIRKAISRVTNLGGVVNAVLVSPEVNETLDLLKDADGRYLGGGPWGTSPNTIWGRPRIEVPALAAENKFILGDFRTCVLWDREDTNITVTDSHADFFVRNLVAILAEARAAFGIFNPSLLVAGADQAA